MPYCKSGIGKRLQGRAVRKSLNSEFTFMFDGSRTVSHSLSNSGNQSSNKWQLHRMTQVPSLFDVWMFLRAFSSLPLPKDKVMMSVSLPLVLASSLMVSPGSDPLPRMNIVGDRSSVSIYTSLSLTGGGYANDSPILSLIKNFMLNTTFSGLSALMIKHFFHSDKLFASPGNGIFWGSPSSTHFFHSFSLSANISSHNFKLGTTESNICTHFYCFSSNQL